MSRDSLHDERANMSAEVAQPATASPTKAVLGGMAAVLAAGAVWVGSLGPPALPPDVRARREAQVESLTPVEREQLRKNFDLFSRLPERERQRLRDLDASFASQPDGDELLVVLGRYTDWLEEIDFGPKNELREMSVEQRIAEIARRRVADYHLPPDDVDVVANWLMRQIKAHFTREPGNRPPPPSEWPRIIDDAVARFQQSVNEGLSSGDELATSIDQLIERLSDATRARLSWAGEKAAQRRVLAGWLSQGETQQLLRREIASAARREQQQVTGDERRRFEAFISRLSEEDQKIWQRDFDADPGRVMRQIDDYTGRSPSRRRRPPPGFGPPGPPPPGGPGDGGFPPPVRGEGNEFRRRDAPPPRPDDE